MLAASPVSTLISGHTARYTRHLRSRSAQETLRRPSVADRGGVLRSRKPLVAKAGESTAQQLPAELTRARQIKTAGFRASGILLAASLTTAWAQGIELPHLTQWLVAVPLLGGTAALFPLLVAVTQGKAQVEVHKGRLYIQWGAPSKGTPLAQGSIQVRPTKDGRGNGAFAVKSIPAGTYIGDYEGEVLTEAAYWARYPSGMSDYCIRVDRECSIDGRSRAKDTNSFSPCHMNHSSRRRNIVRNTSRQQQRVSFFTDRDIEVGEELLLDYGAQYWKTREAEELD